MLSIGEMSAGFFMMIEERINITGEMEITNGDITTNPVKVGEIKLSFVRSGITT